MTGGIAPGPTLDGGTGTTTARFVTGVQQGWHAIDATPFPGCGEHAWALCGAIVRTTKYGAYNPAEVPVSHDPCPQCRWMVAAATGDFESALAELRYPLARATAETILKAAMRQIHEGGEWQDELNDPAMVQLLAHVAAHCPIGLVAEDCSEGECEHVSECPELLACHACSLQCGSWAGEWEGQYRDECKIHAPCEVLLALAATAGVGLDA